MTTPLIELENLRREFPAGEGTIAVLQDVNLTIQSGEMVAIIGASGSGKSTLMNILGCLDRPTSGAYRINGQDTNGLEPDELAALRREYFGFIFQRYHLLSTLTALGNVDVPAIYAGAPRGTRQDRAASLLERLGLGSRLDHKPSQLSGGQQQRVSVARALMNGGQIILADEPTGALDSTSGEEMLKLLSELHQAGHTIIIVTHDAKVADHAERIIEISDGRIIADTRRKPMEESIAPPLADHARSSWRAALGRFGEAFNMALVAMAAHRLRTFLTMLGIIIGIASVVSVVALGQGSSAQILENINSIGTNTIDIYPGKDFGDRKSSSILTLVPRDADLLAKESYADSVTPSVSASGKILRYRNLELSATVRGVGDQFFRVRGYEMANGVSFDAGSIGRRAQVAVIDDNTRQKMFPNGDDPLGQVFFVGDVPVRIIGVTAPKASPFGNSDELNVWLPYTTAMSRILGQTNLQSITVRVADNYDTAVAEQQIIAALERQHGTKDFFTMNTDTIRQTIQKTTETLTLLISAIALISLVVGGIGVMNIMLVSVTERTREIGVRMAVGARQNDILRQFLIEAVLVCFIGGFLGVMAAFGLGFALTHFSSDVHLTYSTTSIVAAFACSTLIGVIFGFLPARSAARLDPVEALARE